MVNPFLRINKTNIILKWSLVALASLLVLTIIFAQNFVNETVKKVYIYKNLLIHSDNEEAERIKKLEEELKKKNSELKKLTQTKSIIKEHILAKNSNIESKTAELYANTIMKESSKRGNSPLVQTALIGSESSFMKNPKHDISGVVGMSGIYWNVWKKELIKEGIAYKKSDLENPITNIKASAYILAVYMNQSNDIPREALTHYKGYSKLGRSQANGVMAVAMKLKNKEGKVC